MKVSAKNPFVSSFDDREAVDIAKLNFLRADSDLFAMLDAFEGWRGAQASGGYRAGNDFCRRNYLSMLVVIQTCLLSHSFLYIALLPKSLSIM